MKTCVPPDPPRQDNWLKELSIMRPCLKGELRVCGLWRRCPYHSVRIPASRPAL